MPYLPSLPPDAVLFDVFRKVGEIPELRDEIGEAGRRAIAHLVGDLTRYMELGREMPTGELLYQFLADTGWLARMSNAKTARDEAEVQNVARFFRRVQEASRALRYDNVREFVKHLDALIEAGEDPAVAGAYRVELSGEQVGGLGRDHRRAHDVGDGSRGQGTPPAVGGTAPGRGAARAPGGLESTGGMRVRRSKVVVTGASAGVGRAIAREFARHGASVGLLARSRDGLDGAADDVKRLGGHALALATDMADDRQVEEAAERIERDLGPIDVWINNAMVSVLSPALRMTSDEYRRVTDVTYHGAVYGTLAALRRMAPRDRGTIVLVGSALAYRGIPLQSAYCAAKHATQGFHDSLRAELIHDGSNVKVTMVQLPALNTPQFEWGRSRMAKRPRPVAPIFQPEVAAEAIVWASAGNESAYERLFASDEGSIPAMA